MSTQGHKQPNRKSVFPVANGSPKKKPYHSPRFLIHGDLYRLTMAKGGGLGDGGGAKPATRASGVPT